MVIKKLLLLGILLLTGQHVRTDASTESLSLASTKPSQTDPSRTASPEAIAPSSPGQVSVQTLPFNTQPPAIRDPLLSSLILPLPPLLLPDLLMPPYDFPSFNSQRLDEELQIYSRYLRTYGTPDVLIVGSSRSLQGIDPTALREGLEAQGYSGVKVFNFGVNGATAQVVDLVLRQVLTAEHMPKLIIWGDGLRAFNDGRPDVTYKDIVASEGYRRLATGDRPIPARTYYQDSPVLTASVDPTLVESALSSTQASISSVLDMYGFQSIADRFDPAEYYRQYPRVPGNYDADYVPFALGGQQTQATIAVARYAQAQNIPLVIVNLPLTRDYMDAQRLQREQTFHQHMQTLAQREKFMFVDLVQHPDLIQNQYFADPSHINREGARAVALHLASHSAIPWQILQSATIAQPEEVSPQASPESAPAQ